MGERSEGQKRTTSESRFLQLDFLVFCFSLAFLHSIMQLPHPSGGLHRFFAPACALTARVKEEEAKRAKEEKESVDHDETENDVPPSSSSSSPLLRPLATKPLVFEAATAGGDAPRVTYSRRKKPKRPAESEGEDEMKEARRGEGSIASLLPTTTTTATKQQHPPPPPPQRKKKALTQTHLDLGQAAFICLTCKQCGMVYAPGDKGDEKTHARFHADALQGPRLLVGSNSSSSNSHSSSALVEVASFPAASDIGSNTNTRGGGKNLLRGRVLHAAPGPALAGAGVRRALAVAEAALGAVPGWLLGVCSSSSHPAAEEAGGEGGSGELAPASLPRRDAASSSWRGAISTAAAAARSGKHAFLFECAETKRAVGVAVVETLASGTRLRRVGGGEGAGGEGTEMTTATEMETTTTAGAAGAALGVRGVWVAPSHRRRGIATAMLDAARARAVTYTVVGRRSLVVFSQPSEAGGGDALARRYAGGKGESGEFWSYL